jgi:quercetin dioxygenase-like cupin family protein
LLANRGWAHHRAGQDWEGGFAGDCPGKAAVADAVWSGELSVTYQPASSQQSGDALASTLKRTEIQHSLSSIPGREIVQVLTEIPVGVESGWHTHPGEEVGYIVAGTVEMAIHQQPTLTLRSGDGFLIPPGTPHNARDIGPGTGQMLSTYVVEVGEPLASFTGEPDDR